MDQENSFTQNSQIHNDKSRRDTIAGFFNDNSSPISNTIGNESHDDKEETIHMDISSPDNNYSFIKTLNSATNSPCTMLENTRNSSKSRDSIACFFESPKYRSIVTVDNDDEKSDQMDSSGDENDVKSDEDVGEISNFEISTSKLDYNDRTPSPKSSTKIRRRYSMTPSPLKETSDLFIIYNVRF